MFDGTVVFDGTDCGKSTRKMAGRSGASRNRAHQHGATPKILGRPRVAETHEAGTGEWRTPGPDAPGPVGHYVLEEDGERGTCHGMDGPCGRS